MSNVNVKLNAVWKGGVEGNGIIKSQYIDTPIAIGTEYGGNGEGASPKEILVSSVQACYVATLVSMVESRKLPVVSIEVDSEMVASDSSFDIIHYPRVVLSADATEKEVQSMERVSEAADRACIVGNMVKKAGVEIEVKGKVSTL
ncbi:OsmC family protein [Bacillus halotolerans]|uniref:OsmC family protein n=1 Tax=Bacillus halotolerans TaxID=260554 RepID=UPI000FD787A2|nr:OsmC family protein [Bacillus halotolerans]AZV50814.1 osmotically inducible protein OsmC [Bacillus halotolerans]QDK66179.1 osmotically inducible protein OsmC [Bacillus halotolerans]UTL75353.1 OsmC family protein [Bacillus halotolerans]WPC79270.1 OsmC family protein [Bacillus halotolerans]